MFLKSEVPISKPTYDNYKHLMRFFRIIGLFPLKVQRNGFQLFLKFSPTLMLGGFVFGGFAIIMAYWGVFLDIGVDKGESIRITSDADKLMFLNDVTAYCAVLFCGVFVLPSSYWKFFSYVRFINQADYIMGIKFTKSETYRHILVLSTIVFVNLVLMWIDLSDCYSILGNKIGLLGVMHRYMGMDGVAFLANVIEYTNQILQGSLGKRLRRLNQLLEVEVAETKNMQKICVIKAATVFKRDLGRLAGAPLCYNRTNTMTKLSQAYQTIMDAAEALHQLVGFTTVVMVVVVLWGLIESSYFLLLAVMEKRGELRDAIEVPGAAAVLAFHVFRTLLLTEPPFACLLQMEKIKRQVCKLLSYNVGRNSRKQTQRLAMVLELRQLRFSACGLFPVDRVLFTSLLDTIVTLLAILIQYRDTLEINL